MNTSLRRWREAATVILAAGHKPGAGGSRPAGRAGGRGGCDYDVLLLERSSRSRFMPAAHVFPGGAVDPADFSADWLHVFQAACRSPSFGLRPVTQPEERRPPLFATDRLQLGSPVPGEVALRICAVRETFEESGVLLAVPGGAGARCGGADGARCGGADGARCGGAEARCGGADGARCGGADGARCGGADGARCGGADGARCGGADVARCGGADGARCGGAEARRGAAQQLAVGISGELAQWRALVNQDPSNFIRMCRELQLLPNIWALHEWSNWLTPEGPYGPRRFDTAFFMCCLEEAPRTLHDEEETVGFQWSTPSEILRSYREQKLWIAPPQFYELSRMCRFSSLNDLHNFSYRRATEGCQQWEPVVVQKEEQHMSLLPGDKLYPAGRSGPSQREDGQDGSGLHRMVFSGPYTVTLQVTVQPECGHLLPVVEPAASQNSRSPL